MSRGIDAFLERFGTDAPHRVDEALAGVAMIDVSVDQPRDDVGHVLRSEGGADDLAERGVVALRAADRHLVPLAAVLVDAEDADVSDVMLATRVHAAGHVEV